MSDEAAHVMRGLFPAEEPGTVRVQGDTSRPYGRYSDVGAYKVGDHDRIRNAIIRASLERDVLVSIASWVRAAGGALKPTRLRAVWVRSSRAAPHVEILPELPATWVIGSEVGREAVWGWLLDRAIVPEHADELGDTLARRAGPDFEAVHGDGYIRLPGTIDHAPPCILVRLLGGSGALYSIEDLSELSPLVAEGEPPGRDERDDPDGDGDGPVPGDVRARLHAVETAPDILALFREQLASSGFAGDTTVAEAVLLVGTSRLLDRPVSLIVRAPSSAGKSFVVETALKFLPHSSYHALTAMSEKAIMWLPSLAHQILVITEGSGLASDTMAYGVRSLLSEGVLRYEYTDFERRTTVRREVPGPTGLIVTTTRPLDPELETRVLTLTVSDSEAQTAAVLRALAAEAAGARPPGAPDHLAFQSLQKRLGERRVDVLVPFAPILSELVDARPIRMRRDFSSILGLIKAHALLHASSRTRGETGGLEANLLDYAAAHRIASAAVAVAAERTVSTKLRQTVEAVAHLAGSAGEPVSAPELARYLGLEVSSTRRRLLEAVDRGYLMDRGGGRGRPHRLVPGDPLPANRGVLPSPSELDAACRRACTPGGE